MFTIQSFTDLNETEITSLFKLKIIYLLFNISVLHPQLPAQYCPIIVPVKMLENVNFDFTYIHYT